MIYPDYNATTPLCHAARDAMLPQPVDDGLAALLEQVLRNFLQQASGAEVEAGGERLADLGWRNLAALSRFFLLTVLQQLTDTGPAGVAAASQ